MNLLQSAILSADAEKYLQAFKRRNVQIEDVKLLTDEDLVEFGVEEDEIRKQLFVNFQNLQLNIEYVNSI